MQALFAVLHRALSALIPPPRLRLSEWIEREVVLPEGASALPGRVRLWLVGNAPSPSELSARQRDRCFRPPEPPPAPPQHRSRRSPSWHHRNHPSFALAGHVSRSISKPSR